MTAELAPGIVVLNKKYFPRNQFSAAQVGASSFACSAIRVLRESGLLCGIVLYQRDEALEEAKCDIEPSLSDDIPVATVSFNFRIPQISIALALGDAYFQTFCQTQSHLPPIIYYQTDTLLHYHPPGFQFCVTHHGPFVSDFSRRFSRSLAELAFGGDSGKVDVLEEQQNLGLDRLRRDSLGTVLAHSKLQQVVLEEQGLAESRFRRIRPPIWVPGSQDANPANLPHRIKQFLEGAEVLLFTAVARLDYFKNVELLIQAGLELLKRGNPIRVLVIGDAETDDSRRRLLLSRIPLVKRKYFFMSARLPKDQLYALFSATQTNGIFLCPSRYETLGITPLEAAVSGVTTLISDLRQVEASRYFPTCCRVQQDSMKIAGKVELIYREGISRWAEMVRKQVRPETTLEVFRNDLLEAWSQMSSSSTRLSRIQETGQYGIGRRCSVEAALDCTTSTVVK